MLTTVGISPKSVVDTHSAMLQSPFAPLTDHGAIVRGDAREIKAHADVVLIAWGREVT
jgi:hypothetical protein